MSKQLRCGVSKKCITPEEKIIKNLVGLKGYGFSGVIDDLYLRVILLEYGVAKTVFLGFDMTTAPCSEEIMNKITEISGVPREGIFFFAIHTHAVPFNDIDLKNRSEQSEETIKASKEYKDFLHNTVIQALYEAMENMQDAKMSWGRGKSFVNVSRIQTYEMKDEKGQYFNAIGLGADFAKEIDHTLNVIRFDNMKNEPIAFFINYSMHNVATIWNDFDGCGNMGISSDIGGNVSCLIEEEFPGTIAMWSSGAAGDLNPIMINEVIIQDPITGRITEEQVKGTELALKSLKIMANRHFLDIRKLNRTMQSYENVDIILSAEEWSVTPGCDCIEEKDGTKQFITGDEVPNHTVRLHLTRIGDVFICGIGAELYSSIGRSIQEILPEKTLIITHDAGTLCKCHYILDDETIELCDKSRGREMIPGYDEFRCTKGVMKNNLVGHFKNMSTLLQK